MVLRESNIGSFRDAPRGAFLQRLLVIDQQQEE